MARYVEPIERIGRYEVALTDRGFVVFDCESAPRPEDHVCVAGAFSQRFKAVQKARELDAADVKVVRCGDGNIPV